MLQQPVEIYEKEFKNLRVWSSDIYKAHRLGTGVYSIIDADCTTTISVDRLTMQHSSFFCASGAERVKRVVGLEFCFLVMSFNCYSA